MEHECWLDLPHRPSLPGLPPTFPSFSHNLHSQALDCELHVGELSAAAQLRRRVPHQAHPFPPKRGPPRRRGSSYWWAACGGRLRGPAAILAALWTPAISEPALRSGPARRDLTFWAVRRLSPGAPAPRCPLAGRCEAGRAREGALSAQVCRSGNCARREGGDRGRPAR
eukprot:363429-Chlamydomonas_euryale.AAC.7